MNVLVSPMGVEVHCDAGGLFQVRSDAGTKIAADNGAKVIDIVVGSPEWKKEVAASKFADKPDFGANRRGKIMLQDHGNDVWFRNVTLILPSASGE